MSPKNVDSLGRACLLIMLVCLFVPFTKKYTSKETFVFQCSVYECGTEGWNIRQMNMFLQQYGREQQSFWCYHQPPKQPTVWTTTRSRCGGKDGLAYDVSCSAMANWVSRCWRCALGWTVFWLLEVGQKATGI